MRYVAIGDTPESPKRQPAGVGGLYLPTHRAPQQRSPVHGPTASAAGTAGPTLSGTMSIAATAVREQDEGADGEPRRAFRRGRTSGSRRPTACVRGREE